MSKYIRITALFVIGAVCFFPFYWIIITSLRGAGDIFQFPPQLLPKNLSLQNYTEIGNAVPIGTYFFNSAFLTVFATIGNVLLASLTGFAMARLSLQGNKLLFAVLLAAIIFPKEILMIPAFGLVVQFGLADSLAGVLLPFLIDALSIYMMRQAYMAIPKEVEEAARMDGCSNAQLWWSVMQPMIKPTLVVVALFTVIGTWSDFMWPMIVLQSPGNYTLQVGLQAMQGTFVNNFRFIAAGTVLSIIPVALLYVLFQKYFINGIFAGAGK